jgi:hypothetical protein
MRQMNPYSTRLNVGDFTRDGQFHNVNVVSKGVTSGAKLVTIELVSLSKQQVGAGAIGMPGIPDSVWEWPIEAGSTVTVTLPVNSDTVQLQSVNDDVAFNVIAEWGGSNVVVPSGDMVQATGWTTGNTGTYRDVDLTSYFGADAGNVEAVLCFHQQEAQATPDTGRDGADSRPEGATISLRDPRSSPTRATAFVKVVNPTDVIEVREGGKALLKGEDPTQNSFVYFIGYILKGSADDGTGSFYTYHGIDAPTDDDVGDGTYQTLDVEPKTSPDVFAIYWRLSRLTTGQAAHYAREVGATDTGSQNREFHTTERPVAVDANKEVEYILEAGALAASWIWGYLDFDGILPEQATDPDPAHLAVDVAVNKILGWTAGAGATSHNVYFGTDPSPDAGEFQGNQPGTSFDPGILETNTTYYWRIDEVNALGTTSGVVWSFTTSNDCNWFDEPSSDPDWQSGAAPGDFFAAAAPGDWFGSGSPSDWASTVSGADWFDEKDCN